MLLVTGGAGFIGSNVVAALNDAGRSDVAVCDFLGTDGKWRNLAKRQLVDIAPPAELPDWLNGRRLDAVIHLGAISATTPRPTATSCSKPISASPCACSTGARRMRCR
ncbi:nucleoside-diphosphate-sugar epimerase [Bradyrhizobium diazoefficiens]